MHHPGQPGSLQSQPQPHHHQPGAAQHPVMHPGGPPPQPMGLPNPGMAPVKRAREDEVEEPRYGTRNGKRQRRDDEDPSGEDDPMDAEIQPGPRQPRPVRSRSASVKQDQYLRD